MYAARARHVSCQGTSRMLLGHVSPCDEDVEGGVLLVDVRVAHVRVLPRHPALTPTAPTRSEPDSAFIHGIPPTYRRPNEFSTGPRVPSWYQPCLSAYQLCMSVPDCAYHSGVSVPDTPFRVQSRTQQTHSSTEHGLAWDGTLNAGFIQTGHRRLEVASLVAHTNELHYRTGHRTEMAYYRTGH